MHAALLSNGKVVFLDKLENYTESKLPTGRNAYSVEYDPTTHELSPLSLSSNAFCCGDIRALRNNNPTYELLDKQGKPNSRSIPLDILVKNQPYWMYPFLHLLRDGTLFVFTAKSSQIFDVDKNRIIRQLPDLKGLERTYPNTGGSVMLPLTKQNNYKPQIMICGGGEIDDIFSATDETCGTISPMSAKPEWKMTKMPGGGRLMVEGTLLLDGTVLWLNGARLGCQGFGTASNPALEALIYDPQAESWATAGKTDIPRMYHSVALMLLDGTILIAGSNPNEMPLLEENVVQDNPTRAYATEFRVEKYIPHYLLENKAEMRPTEMRIRDKILVPGGTITTISFDLNSNHVPKDVKVLLYHGGFVTHSLHMGQVMVEMESLPPKLKYFSGNQWTVEARVPDIKIAPGPYVIYVVVDGVPSIGQFVSIQIY
ncbi:hypothetical protein LTR05_003126 [Lithohypha guttulata]|uniref:Galactose oxidase n=1 Tax=Lithohypha guttulata TaxID=1690604 RepID=A0AAN7Y882_9EURO|nr:hypothetical protein LTR05_003126 [Lithohypha guttulata]